MTKPRLVLSVTAVVVLLAGAALYAQPYWVVHQMYSAVESRDSAAIASFVDFPVLRESVKNGVGAAISNGVSSAGGGLLGGLGAAFAGAVVSPVVDAMVTPDAIAVMMSGEKPGQPGVVANTLSSADVSMGYSGLNAFVVKAQGHSLPAPVALTFTRENLSWKLSAVALPPDVAH